MESFIICLICNVPLHGTSKAFYLHKGMKLHPLKVIEIGYMKALTDGGGGGLKKKVFNFKGKGKRWKGARLGEN